MSAKEAVPSAKAASMDVSVGSVPLAAAPSLEPASDVGHQARLMREALQSEKRRLGFLLGAGCPLGIYDKGNKESLKHIPDVAGLTAVVGRDLESEAAFSQAWTRLTAACKTDNVPIPNVEHILTQLRTICSLKGTEQVDGMPIDILRKLDGRICELIANHVGAALPSHTNAYHRLAAWIGHIDRVTPVEVFTSNYDLLLEEALEQFGVPFFDGFVGARSPFFDLAAMEQDAVPPRWTRLWKLHGSINWIKRKDGSVFRSSHPARPEEGEQLLIYPSHLKYEQSRRMPYLAMVDRLRAFFRDANPVLVVCGYSFGDDDLNEVLLDGLRGNRSAHCFALAYPSISECAVVASHAGKLANLTVLARDAAVVGTRRGAYKPVDPTTSGLGTGHEAGSESGGPLGVSAGLCTLGDFHHFTLFLETQFGVKNPDR
jgi:hypothetical protein